MGRKPQNREIDLTVNPNPTTAATVSRKRNHEDEGRQTRNQVEAAQSNERATKRSKTTRGGGSEDPKLHNLTSKPLQAGNPTVVAANADSAASLVAFNPYSHLQAAYAGPTPLCLVMDDASSDSDMKDDSAKKLMFPFFLHFLDEQFAEIPAPADFFTPLPAGAPHDAHKQTYPFLLQHVLHACLHHRHLSSPVQYGALTVYPIQQRFPKDGHAFTELYVSLAKLHGAQLYDVIAEGTKDAQGFYLRFGVQIDLPLVEPPKASNAKAASAANITSAMEVDELPATGTPAGKKRGRKSNQEREALNQASEEAAAASAPKSRSAGKRRESRSDKQGTSGSELKASAPVRSPSSKRVTKTVAKSNKKASSASEKKSERKAVATPSPKQSQSTKGASSQSKKRVGARRVQDTVRKTAQRAPPAGQKSSSSNSKKQSNGKKPGRPRRK